MSPIVGSSGEAAHSKEGRDGRFQVLFYDKHSKRGSTPPAPSVNHVRRISAGDEGVFEEGEGVEVVLNKESDSPASSIFRSPAVDRPRPVRLPRRPDANALNTGPPPPFPQSSSHSQNAPYEPGPPQAYSSRPSFDYHPYPHHGQYGSGGAPPHSAYRPHDYGPPQGYPYQQQQQQQRYPPHPPPQSHYSSYPPQVHSSAPPSGDGINVVSPHHYRGSGGASISSSSGHHGPGTPIRSSSSYGSYQRNHWNSGSPPRSHQEGYTGSINKSNSYQYPPNSPVSRYGDDRNYSHQTPEKRSMPSSSSRGRRRSHQGPSQPKERAPPILKASSYDSQTTEMAPYQGEPSSSFQYGYEQSPGFAPSNGPPPVVAKSPSMERFHNQDSTAANATRSAHYNHSRDDSAQYYQSHDYHPSTPGGSGGPPAFEPGFSPGGYKLDSSGSWGYDIPQTPGTPGSPIHGSLSFSYSDQPQDHYHRKEGGDYYYNPEHPPIQSAPSYDPQDYYSQGSPQRPFPSMRRQHNTSLADREDEEMEEDVHPLLKDYHPANDGATRQEQTKTERSVKPQFTRGDSGPAKYDVHSDESKKGSKSSKVAKKLKSSAILQPPDAAKEVDFECTNPPLTPVLPPSTMPDCMSPAEISMNDVLCGRGGGTNSQIGNRRFRQLVTDFQPVYLLARRKEKPLIARTIVLILRNRGGRFLKKDEASGGMFDVGDIKAEAKTSQALREGLDVRATKKVEKTEQKMKKAAQRAATSATKERNEPEKDAKIVTPRSNEDSSEDAVIKKTASHDSNDMSCTTTQSPSSEDRRKKMSTPPPIPALDEGDVEDQDDHIHDAHRSYPEYYPGRGPPGQDSPTEYQHAWRKSPDAYQNRKRRKALQKGGSKDDEDLPAPPTLMQTLPEDDKALWNDFTPPRPRIKSVPSPFEGDKPNSSNRPKSRQSALQNEARSRMEERMGKEEADPKSDCSGAGCSMPEPGCSMPDGGCTNIAMDMISDAVSNGFFMNRWTGV
eukprot:CAMPEP_0198303914 /NCGR_PEP_ID=MMETSP1449-20131203/57133_1 /TAXON_ID=420275 /ORGANISM="Attheya septentrionalis, Strain CCMP2084" /LENGTH=1001 /DNA_ID=CAMNT_0044006421 /DNA_START=351 /DNA_END=3356 /DNA_ORIENTATION=-